MPTSAQKRPDFLFLGGHPAIDLVNTHVPPPGLDIEFLREWNDVVDWLGHAGISTSPALRVPLAARGRALKEFAEFREAWRNEVEQVVAGGSVSDDFLKRLNRHLGEVVFTEALQRSGEKRFELVSSYSELRGQKLALALMAREVAWFLAEANPAYLRRCANTESCVLYFYDTTKNHHRQWCSVAMCGNRHKVAEFRRRKALEKAFSRRRETSVKQHLDKRCR
jgi:predicted RNA-binding Zn ribbon-like protein